MLDSLAPSQSLIDAHTILARTATTGGFPFANRGQAREELVNDLSPASAQRSEQADSGAGGIGAGAGQFAFGGQQLPIGI